MISIRPAAAADFTAISAIDHSAHSHPWPSSVLKRYVEKPHCTWVLEVDGQVLAFAVNTLVADEAELLTIAVSPKQQGLGYGRELMNFLQQSYHRVDESYVRFTGTEEKFKGIADLVAQHMLKG